jgi:hypothetical protein
MPRNAPSRLSSGMFKKFNWASLGQILIIYTFCRFCHDLRGHVKEQHPEYTLGEIAKELGRRWGVSDDATKAQYAAKAEQDRARYERVSSIYS